MGPPCELAYHCPKCEQAEQSTQSKSDPLFFRHLHYLRLQLSRVIVARRGKRTTQYLIVGVWMSCSSQPLIAKPGQPPTLPLFTHAPPPPRQTTALTANHWHRRGGVGYDRINTSHFCHLSRWTRPLNELVGFIADPKHAIQVRDFHDFANRRIHPAESKFTVIFLTLSS